MANFDRRKFLGSSMGGLATMLALRPMVFAANGDNEPPPPPFATEITPSTLFLTWQRDPTTTMTIQWVDRETTGGASIQYKRLDAEVWQSASTLLKPFPNTSLKVYRCQLTGLAPGGEYQFQIGTQPATYRFRTMPARADNTIQFVSGGDCGTNLHAIGTNKLAARQEPYFALIGGDLAYDNGRSPETFLQFLRNYSAHMIDAQGRLVPMLSCIGNHEVDGGYSAPRAKSPQYLSVFDGLFEHTSYGVLDVGDYLSLVLLDTGHIAPIAGEQTDWLEKTLADRQDRPHLIAANHVPAYPSYRAPVSSTERTGTGEDQRVHWCPLFEKYKVDVVLEHHDHLFKRTHPLTNGMIDKNGVVYLGDGSWGRLRALNPAAGDRPYLATVNSTYHLTVHRLEGDQRFHVALEESGKVADVCMTASKRPSR